MHNFKHTRAIHNVSHIWTERQYRGLEGSDSTGAYCASGASKFGHFSQPIRSLRIQLRQFKAYVLFFLFAITLLNASEASS